jgi:hypothetical protein
MRHLLTFKLFLPLALFSSFPEEVQAKKKILITEREIPKQLSTTA